MTKPAHSIQPLPNPFKPGAGHMPPYLAGREAEKAEFECLLTQETILQNVILTGLRGLGKTVLLETFKPMAIQQQWLWVGTDLGEATCVSEQRLALRLLTDLSVVTSSLVYATTGEANLGFGSSQKLVEHTLNFPTLWSLFENAPGLVSDKLKYVFTTVWDHLKHRGKRGIVFAYDEAQNLTDHAAKEEFPTSLLLDVFQSIQRQEIPFMLVLTGLPTLFPKLVEARTFAERMFRIIFLQQLDEKSSREAILTPIKKHGCPIEFSPESVNLIIELTGGYPYLIQYICREVFDIWVQKASCGEQLPSIPVNEILRKLDADFFAGRWARATDRQRDLLRVIARLPNCDNEFTVQEVVEKSKSAQSKPFSSSHVNQMLASLGDVGLVYKNRWSKYSFAVPLLGQFIRRQNGSWSNDLHE